MCQGAGTIGGWQRICQRSRPVQSPGDGDGPPAVAWRYPCMGGRLPLARCAIASRVLLAILVGRGPIWRRVPSLSVAWGGHGRGGGRGHRGGGWPPPGCQWMATPNVGHISYPPLEQGEASIGHIVYLPLLSGSIPCSAARLRPLSQISPPAGDIARSEKPCSAPTQSASLAALQTPCHPGACGWAAPWCSPLRHCLFAQQAPMRRHQGEVDALNAS